jgi:Tfp pilus assembly protein PilP
MRRLIVLGGGIVLMLVAAAVWAQAPVRPAPKPAPAVTAAQAPAYSYNPDGRRDPFISLLRRGTDVTRGQGKPGDGVAGMLINELVLRGIMQSRHQYVALVQGPDTKTYIVRVNDRLADGSIRAITADSLILMQDVNDPLSATKQREVRRTLRAAVEQK